MTRKETTLNCSVCLSSANGSFYGAIACNPCRTFFRRRVLSKRTLGCCGNYNCPVNGEKIICVWCRFQKCLAVGMKPELVNSRVGNISNIMKPKGKVKISDMSYNESTPDSLRIVAENNMVSRRADSPFTNVVTILDLNTLAKHYSSYSQNPTSLFSAFNGCSDFLKLKSSPSCSLQFKVIEAKTIPCKKKELVIEILNKNGYVSTLLKHSQLALNPREQSINPSIVTIHTRRGHLIFSKNQDSETDIQVYLPMGLFHENVIVMKQVTEDHWKRLHQMVPVARLLNRLASVTFLTSPSSSEYNWQRVILMATNEAATHQATAVIESVINGLILEDQIIVLKEALLPVSFLLRMHVFSQEDQSLLLSAFGNEVYFAVHLSYVLNIEGRDVFDLCLTFIKEFYPFLREDFFVITILCILCILDDRPGISSTDFFDRERIVFHDLLDKYITAMIENGQWSVNRELIWSNIKTIMGLVPKYSLMKIRTQRSILNNTS